MKTKLKKLKFTLEKKYYQNFNDIDISKDVFLISGMPRGGTTWIMELLYQQNMLLLWEPLHFKNLANYNTSFLKEMGYLPYIPEEASWPEAITYFDKLFNGKIQTYPMVRGHNSSNLKLQNQDKIILKFCRSNMILPWLTKNFSIKPIYLVRHPLAVIASQYKHNAFDTMNWENGFFSYEDQKYTEIFTKYENNIRKIKTKEDFFANWWAIDNVLALNNPNRGNKWLLVFYENLMLNLEKETFRIRSFTSLKRLNTDKANLPSATSKQFNADNKQQLAKWKSYFTKNQIHKILDIVNNYGIDCYSDNVLPLK